jgi:hypothetical protein
VLSGAPSRLLDKNNVRQSRPGLSLLTSRLRIPFEPLLPAACLVVAIGQLLHVLLKDGPYA